MLVTIWNTVDVALIANNGVGNKGIFWICWLRIMVFVLCTEHKMIDILFVCKLCGCFCILLLLEICKSSF